MINWSRSIVCDYSDQSKLWTPINTDTVVQSLFCILKHHFFEALYSGFALKYSSVINNAAIERASVHSPVANN